MYFSLKYNIGVYLAYASVTGWLSTVDYSMNTVDDTWKGKPAILF